MDVMYGGRDTVWRKVATDELPEGGKILEVGAGTGRTQGVQTVSEDYYSLDISQSMLASSETIDRPVQGDVHTLPFEADSFDGVIGVLLFSTQINQSRAIEELKRVCKSDGTIVLVDKFSGKTRWNQLLDRLLTVATHPVGFDFCVDIEALVARSELDVSKRQPMPNNMNMIELVVLRP